MTLIFITRQEHPNMHVWCKFGDSIPNLWRVIMPLFCRQAKIPRILSQNSQNDLEGQGQRPLFSIPAQNIPGCIFFTNLMILAQICDELSCGQSKVHGRTDGRTDAGKDNIPSAWKAKGLKWTNWYHFHFYFNYHLMYCQLKTNSVGITEVSVVPMANNMYFIQWIITSYYPNGYKLYRNNFVCIKTACF